MSVSELPSGYRDVPDEDRKKAQAFFERGKSVADAGQFDYAITMYLQGLDKDPENVDAHKALRDISMKRKVSGGKDLGMFDKMKLKKGGKDDKENLTNAEKLLCYDPGNVANMVGVALAAHKAGYYDTSTWAAGLAFNANVSNPKGPDYKTFL